MSQFSSAHDVVSYDPKAVPAMVVGMRLSKVQYKTPRNKDGSEGTKKPSSCVMLPQVTTPNEEELAGLMPHVLAMLEATQDAIVRKRIESGQIVILDSEVSVASCIAWLDADATGDRLTKEYICAWFAEALQDLLLVAVADKLGVSDTPSELEAKKLEQICNVYRDNFAMLAGGKTRFDADKAGKLQKVLDLLPDDALGAKFYKRLEGMKVKEKEQVELLDL